MILAKYWIFSFCCFIVIPLFGSSFKNLLAPPGLQDTFLSDADAKNSDLLIHEFYRKYFDKLIRVSPSLAADSSDMRKIIYKDQKQFISEINKCAHNSHIAIHGLPEDDSGKELLIWALLSLKSEGGIFLETAYCKHPFKNIWYARIGTIRIFTDYEYGKSVVSSVCQVAHIPLDEYEPNLRLGHLSWIDVVFGINSGHTHRPESFMLSPQDIAGTIEIAHLFDAQMAMYEVATSFSDPITGENRNFIMAFKLEGKDKIEALWIACKNNDLESTYYRSADNISKIYNLENKFGINFSAKQLNPVRNLRRNNSLLKTLLKFERSQYPVELSSFNNYQLKGRSNNLSEIILNIHPTTDITEECHHLRFIAGIYPTKPYNPSYAIRESGRELTVKLINTGNYHMFSILAVADTGIKEINILSFKEDGEKLLRYKILPIEPYMVEMPVGVDGDMPRSRISEPLAYLQVLFDDPLWQPSDKYVVELVDQLGHKISSTELEFNHVLTLYYGFAKKLSLIKQSMLNIFSSI